MNKYELGYKECGIYTKDNQVAVTVTAILVGFVFVLHFPITQTKSLTNADINSFLELAYSTFQEKDIDIWINYKESDRFKDWGYLGQINDGELRNKIIKYIWEIKDL